MSEIHVAIPSYKRPNKVRALGAFPHATVYVPDSQFAAYSEALPVTTELVAIPDTADGNIARKRNWILDHAPSEWVLMVDDDLLGIGVWEGLADQPRRLGVDEAMAFVSQGFRMATEAGVHLWGINLVRDRRTYCTIRPFGLLAPILGTFAGHALPTLRYDEGFFTKEDYDFWLQHIEKYRRTLRFNKYVQEKRDEETGGLSGWRTMEREKQMADRLITKWGKIVRYNTKYKGILDARVSIPIPGC